MLYYCSGLWINVAIINIFEEKYLKIVGIYVKMYNFAIGN